MAKLLGGREPEEWGKILAPENLCEEGREDLGGPYPIVFNFRPNQFLLVNEELREDWVTYFEKNVGAFPKKPVLDPDSLVGWSGDPKETISGSNDGWDDCDYW